MHLIKTKLISTKNHFVNHRGTYGTIVGLTAGLMITVRASKTFNEFLDEKGLLDEYYYTGEE